MTTAHHCYRRLQALMSPFRSLKAYFMSPSHLHCSPLINTSTGGTPWMKVKKRAPWKSVGWRKQGEG